MNNINLDKIYDIKIPILSKNIQETICNYYNYSNKLYQDNKKQIEIYKNMKECIFNSLLTSNYIELNEIIDLKLSNEINDNLTPFIGIIRNGLTTGTVILITNNIISNNSYYLLLKKNTSFLIEFIYYYLQNNQNKLKELSNLTQQNSLNKSNLLLFKIPIILLDYQKCIISYCVEFDNIINKHIENNQTIKNKDIMSIINKIYNIT
jgi:restriction endonuclease S subunit